MKSVRDDTSITISDDKPKKELTKEYFQKQKSKQRVAKSEGQRFYCRIYVFIILIVYQICIIPRVGTVSFRIFTWLMLGLDFQAEYCL